MRYPVLIEVPVPASINSKAVSFTRYESVHKPIA